MTTRSVCRARCKDRISARDAGSGVYTRPAAQGNCLASPKMCVWQSHAPLGTSKFTGVVGWEALAKTSPGRPARNAAPAIPARLSRSLRVSIRKSSLLSAPCSDDGTPRVQGRGRRCDRGHIFFMGRAVPQKRPGRSGLLHVSIFRLIMLAIARVVAVRGTTNEVPRYRHPDRNLTRK